MDRDPETKVARPNDVVEPRSTQGGVLSSLSASHTDSIPILAAIN